ncbi:SAM-dependent DNA methyltransferase, partial [Vibrio cholerae]|nr:SAM-dependent DNA methyltransferase [Vibrio cholerae]
VCDPACGTGGFLSTTYEYLLEKYSSPQGVEKEQVFDNDGKPVLDVYGNPVFNTLYAGDLLSNRWHIDEDMFHGFDFDSTMLRVAA